MNPSDPRTDEQLAEAVVNGDFGSFELLVRRYTDKVYRLAWSYVRSDHEADDVMQETFINVYRALPRFEGKSKLGSWIYRITVNTALMRLRRKRRRPEVSIEGSKPEDATGSDRESPFLVDHRTAADDFSATELRGEIQQAVDSLEEKYRVVFLLRDVEGLSIQETAEALEISVPAVKSRLHRARLFLRASLERYVSS